VSEVPEARIRHANAAMRIFDLGIEAADIVEELKDQIEAHLLYRGLLAQRCH
jgi:hypothetical protein